MGVKNKITKKSIYNFMINYLHIIMIPCKIIAKVSKNNVK